MPGKRKKLYSKDWQPRQAERRQRLYYKRLRAAWPAATKADKELLKEAARLQLDIHLYRHRLGKLIRLEKDPREIKTFGVLLKNARDSLLKLERIMRSRSGHTDQRIGRKEFREEQSRTAGVGTGWGDDLTIN